MNEMIDAMRLLMALLEQAHKDNSTFAQLDLIGQIGQLLNRMVGVLLSEQQAHDPVTHHH